MLESFTVLLNVEDVPASIAFYGELFGFEVVQQFEENNAIRWTSLRKDQIQLMLNEHGEQSNDQRVRPRIRFP